MQKANSQDAQTHVLDFLLQLLAVKLQRADQPRIAHPQVGLHSQLRILLGELGNAVLGLRQLPLRVCELLCHVLQVLCQAGFVVL